MSIARTISRYSCFLLLGVLSGAAFALVNPIDPALPLTTHVRVWCEDGTGNFPSAVGDSAASCSDALDAGSGVVSNSSASADLSQGTMRSVTTSRNYFDGGQSIGARALTSLDVYDTLTVNGNFAGTRAVELRLAVDGSLFDNVPGGFQSWGGDIFGGITFFYSDRDVDAFASTGLHVVVAGEGTPLLMDFATTGGATLTTNAADDYVFDPANVQFVMSYVFPATTGNRTFSFYASLFFSPRFSSLVPGSFGEGTFDFGNTARFSLIVPQDVTASSASGAFLTAVPAVPEPSTVALLATGIAALIARTRRRVT